MLGTMEKIYKALADRTRLRILNMLKKRAMCVCEITEVLQLSQSTVSGHLRVLKEASIVEARKDGLWIEYSLCKNREMNAKLLNVTETFFDADREMKEERRKALGANRRILCEK